MKDLLRVLGILTIGVALATSSIAWAQTYTSIDYPGAQLTVLAGGPNPQGTSVGYWQDASGVFHGFSLTAGGVFTSFDPPGSIYTVPNGINPEGVIAGGYIDASFVSHGFMLSEGTYTTVDYPGAPGSILTSMNPSGEISGFYCSDPACGETGGMDQDHSFVLSKKGGVFTTFDPPGATSSEAAVVIPSGAVVGVYDTLAEATCDTVCQGYMLFDGRYTTITYPGSQFTFATGANAEGKIVGAYYDPVFGVYHAFLFSSGVYTSFDFPGAIFTEASGINPANVIVGAYVDSAGNEHGYIRTP
ncbi:MAG TPA: hypothetical protein VKV05_10245 [Terriglobales bacterium]|nr:hypothetical protein [Terriglobales bacterium]